MRIGWKLAAEGPVLTPQLQGCPHLIQCVTLFLNEGIVNYYVSELAYRFKTNKQTKNL